MEEQFQNEAPAKPKGGIIKMVIINAIVSVVVSSLVAYIFVSVMTGPLTARVEALSSRVLTLEQLTVRIDALEQQVNKITSVYHVGK
jgi:flagellar basal body-associated protein FliL